jgi:hypothetical protein
MSGIRRSCFSASFLTILVGFLTVGTAAPVDEALARLDELEGQRAEIRARADSLGAQLGRLAESQRPRILQEAERLSGRARDLDVEILLERGRCRSLATQELDRLRDASTPEASQREAVLLRVLETRLGGDWNDELVFVEPDSTDGYETLLDKLAYLTDLQERIVGLQKNLDRRIDRTRRELGLRRASEGLAEESRFLDEGGRVGSDDVVLLHGVAGGGNGTPGQGRLATSASGVEGTVEGDLVPLEGSTVDSNLAVLARARVGLDANRERVVGLLRITEDLLRRYPAAPR